MKKFFLAVFAMLLAVAQFSICAAASSNLTYRAHVAGDGWQREVSEGEMAGTTGENRQLEALVINLDDGNRAAIEYCAHVEGEGWQNWRTSGDVAGTTGRSLRMEAIKIRLLGRYAERYSVVYRVHASGIGWMDWVRDGEIAGTTGEHREIEAIQIRLQSRNNSHRYDDDYRGRHNRHRYDKYDDDYYYKGRNRY